MHWLHYKVPDFVVPVHVGIGLGREGEGMTLLLMVMENETVIQTISHKKSIRFMICRQRFQHL